VPIPGGPQTEPLSVRDAAPSALPRVLFFNINGSGMGHMSTCLAYAHRLRGRARPVFFSLASAIEMIQDMGFEADYFVSHFWSRSKARVWNQQLAVRLGLMLERVQPHVLVFDGNWPFQGLMDAAATYGVPRMVWSNLVLHKADMPPVPVSEQRFDVVIQLGELGTEHTVERAAVPGRKVIVPPVTLLRDDELLSRPAARDALGLARDGRFVLFSLGPGNLKDVSGIAPGLLTEARAGGYQVVWARPPISVRDVSLPEGVVPISVYPLVRYMRAFDAFIGAAGYNTCCEVVQSGVPALFVPNTLVDDDQTQRARHVAERARAIVSPCETAAERTDAVSTLLALVAAREPMRLAAFDLGGAERAAEEILGLLPADVRP
jgi:UDP-N-acetylglucosamine:LPS N-acetylglucosamine transferase